MGIITRIAPAVKEKTGRKAGFRLDQDINFSDMGARIGMGYFKTTVRAGKTMEVMKSYTRRVGAKKRGRKAKPTAEEMEKINQMNAERRLRIKINANFGEGDPFITLTYRKGERPVAEAAKKDIGKLIGGLRRKYKKAGAELKWVCVTEYLNKAIHHHLLINRIDGQDVSRWVCMLWKFGRPNFTPLDGSGQYKDLAAYLIKETSKTYRAKDGERKQRYSCSRNLVVPRPKTEIVRRAKKWLPDPRPARGYYIDKDTVYNGIDPFTGREYQRYTMVLLPDGRGKGKCG